MSADAVKLQVRMDRSLKEQAEEVFAEMGLDTTTAVRIFFTKVVQTRSIPFRAITALSFKHKELCWSWIQRKS